MAGGSLLDLLHINTTAKTTFSGEALLFDLAPTSSIALSAHFGSRIAGKRLIVVPAGALATLLFQVLVTEQPTPRSRRTIATAGGLAGQAAADHGMPSIASLEALRMAVPVPQRHRSGSAIRCSICPEGGYVGGGSPTYRNGSETCASKAGCPRDPPPPPQGTRLTRLGRSAAAAARSVGALLALPKRPTAARSPRRWRNEECPT